MSGQSGQRESMREGSALEAAGPPNGPPWKPILVVAVILLVVPGALALISIRGSDPGPAGVGTVRSGPNRFLLERPELTATDSSCYEKPGVGDPGTAPASPVSPVRFTEMTRAAGLCHIQHEYKIPPNCFFNRPGDVPGQNIEDAARMYSECLVERFSGGAAVGDYDGDGKPDVYLTQLRKGPPGVLMKNNGDGTFADVTAGAHLDSVEGNGNGALFADIDNDGDRDLVVATVGGGRDLLFVNAGDGTFVEQGQRRGIESVGNDSRRGMSVAAGDYDNDGFLDLFFTDWRMPVDWGPSPNRGARLLHNKGADSPGLFEDVTERAGVVLGDPDKVQMNPAYEPYMDKSTKDHYKTASFAAAFVDLDGDRLQDLVVISDFGTSQLFWNNGDGTFVDGTSAAGFAKEGNGMGLAVADFDRDGRPDVFVTAIYANDSRMPVAYTGNKLYQNVGNRQFEDVTARYELTDGSWGWGTAAADFDNDGNMDIVMTNGQFTGMYHDILGREEHVGTPKRLWMNRGNGTFAEVAEAAGIRTRADGKGLVTFDSDGDGDLDLLMVNNGQHPTFYRNDIPRDPSWIGVKVMSQSPLVNADGLGVVVKVTDSSGRIQVQQVGVASAFLGQSDPVAGFGLGAADGPVQIEVTFPTTGETRLLTGVGTRHVEVVSPTP